MESLLVIKVCTLVPLRLRLSARIAVVVANACMVCFQEEAVQIVRISLKSYMAG